MSIKVEVERLRKVGLFAGVAPERLLLLALTGVEPVTYEAGEVLFRKGDAASAAYVIVEGSVQMLLGARDGEIVVAIIGRDGIVGETSLLCDTRRRASVRAAEPVKALRIAKDAFERLLAGCPHLSLALLRTMALQYDQLVEAFLRSDRDDAERVWLDRPAPRPCHQHPRGQKRLLGHEHLLV